MEYLILLVFALGTMYLLVVLPQRRRMAAHERMVSDIAVGTEIVTAGGIYGTVMSIGDEELGVEVAPGTILRVSKRAVAAVVDAEPEAAREAGSGEDRPS